MANHMEKVAKMLGVKIGERFKIHCSGADFILYDDGLYCTQEPGRCDKVLNGLLNGTCAIEHKPCKPSYGDEYYSIGPSGVLEPGVWMGDFVDRALYRLGNCYYTQQEAEANKDKWIAFYESDEMLEV